MATIGFVGLGHMGLPMAQHLINAGHQVSGFDVQQAALEAFIAVGGQQARCLQTLGETQDVLITMLQTGEQVKQVCLGEQGMFAQARPQSLFIDCSTIDVDSAREVHQQAETRGLIAVDAPVSGGVAGAVARTLTFMVGGSLDAFEQAKPILEQMGKTIIHTGDPGSGQAAKICNNMILGMSMIAISEAFVLAEQLGLSAQKLFDVVTHASGQCWAMSHYVPVPGILENVPANHDYQPGFSAAMMLKDLNLSQQSARATGVSPALSQFATSLYQQFNEQGMGEKDFSGIINLIKALALTNKIK